MARRSLALLLVAGLALAGRQAGLGSCAAVVRRPLADGLTIRT
jgi:hypothetical protein